MTLAPALRALFVTLLLLAGLGPAARADERIGVIAAALEPVAGGGVVLNATFEFELPQALEDVVQKGIAIYFNIEFELFRKRWYWLDRKVSSSTLTYRLSYSPLTRQYRLARGGLSQPFDSLDEALNLLKSVRQWKVVEPGVLVPRDPYEAQVRMRLDVTQLPKPFQVNAITSREWQLASDWRELEVPAEAAR
ncbi:MAG TPA: DUF4390 domain-containing protein [Burkholderiaceae bacterium]|nr:DUF4390 domain-containing protein [Burkholderiaceae bacterium]HQR69781.1 DUF4390 domain-containing protein [Burkholderiaceae bacterium]